MRVTDFIKLDEQNGRNIIFLRVDPEDISITLSEIIDALSDLSWISKFDKAYLRQSYRTRAESTVKHICQKIQDGAASGVYGDAAEYIVSEVARETLVKHLMYKDIPLGELFKEQISGNPGFDYFTANLSDVIIFGEACYPDLVEKYENPIEHACDIQEGQVWIANGWQKPDGLCDSAWESMSAFVMTLAHGGGNFYDGWMKNPKSAMISCNDGFRPVSFYIEALDEDAD